MLWGGAKSSIPLLPAEIDPNAKREDLGFMVLKQRPAKFVEVPNGTASPLPQDPEKWVLRELVWEILQLMGWPPTSYVEPVERFDDLLMVRVVNPDTHTLLWIWLGGNLDESRFDAIWIRPKDTLATFAWHILPSEIKPFGKRCKLRTVKEIGPSVWSLVVKGWTPGLTKKAVKEAATRFRWHATKAVVPAAAGPRRVSATVLLKMGSKLLDKVKLTVAILDALTRARLLLAYRGIAGKPDIEIAIAEGDDWGTLIELEDV